MKNQAQLIAYVDRLTGGTFADLDRMLIGPLNGVFGGVHVLPFFDPIDGADAGFDPIDHTVVDPRLGTWADVRALAAQTEIMADVIVNHVSSRSPQFRDFVERGTGSAYAGMFLTYAHVFPNGARERDLLALHRLRPDLPFTSYDTVNGPVLLWTTFTPQQIDIDVHHSEGRRYLDAVLTRFHEAGIRAIRLDAAGFAVKKAGTSCFMIPETFAFIAEFTAQAHAIGIEVLVETHAHHLEQVRIAGHVDWVYDFALPPLVLHTLYTRDATALLRWLEVRPRNSITVLDTHDGIGVLDAADLLSREEIDRLVETIHERSNGESREATGGAAHNLDVHQINCTFYDALGGRDEEYLIARALQCFVPGTPQVYYVGLLAGRNDMALLRRTGVGRDINRRYYAAGEAEEHLRRPVVQRLLSLLRIRNTHPAFGGVFTVKTMASDCVAMEWRDGAEWARLDVSLTTMRAEIGVGGHFSRTQAVEESTLSSKNDLRPQFQEVVWSSGR
jgi:sucrose phosphorylase